MEVKIPENDFFKKSYFYIKYSIGYILIILQQDSVSRGFLRNGNPPSWLKIS